MGRQLTPGDRVTLPAGTLAVLTNTRILDGRMADWREGDVCMFDRDEHLFRAGARAHTGWRNLRTGQVTDWPSMIRFALLEDETNG